MNVNSKWSLSGHLVFFDQREFHFGSTRHHWESMCEVLELLHKKKFRGDEGDQYSCEQKL